MLVDTKGRRLESLDIEIFDNALSLNPVSTVDVSAYFDNARPEQTQIVAFPFNASTDAVHRITYSIEGMSEPLSTGYREGNSGFDYLSDLTFRAGTGWDHWTADIAYDRTSALDISGQKYRKGFETHALGICGVDLRPEQIRSICDRCGRTDHLQPHARTPELRPPHGIQRNCARPNGQCGMEHAYPMGHSSRRHIENIHPVRRRRRRKHQRRGMRRCATILLFARRKAPAGNIMARHRPRNQRMPPHLRRSRSHGLFRLDVIYAVTEGNEYARIENGNTLSIFNIPPESASVTVTAYQPGNNVWAPAQLSSRTFNVANRVVVRRDERIELDGPLNIKEMTVYADNFSAGQVLVKSDW